MRARVTWILLPALVAGCALPSSQPAPTPEHTDVAPPSMPPDQPSVAPQSTDTPVVQETPVPTPRPERTRSFADANRPPRTPRPERQMFDREPPTPRPTRTPRQKHTPTAESTPDLSGPPDTPPPTEVAMAATPKATEEIPVISSGNGAMEWPLPAGTTPLALAKVRVAQTDEGLVLELDVTGDVPHHRVFRLQNPGRIVVDLEETEVPGGSAGPKAGTSPVKEIKASELGSASGNQVARVQFFLDSDSALATKPSEQIDGHTLRVSFKPKH